MTGICLKEQFHFDLFIYGYICEYYVTIMLSFDARLAKRSFDKINGGANHIAAAFERVVKKDCAKSCSDTAQSILA